MHPAKALRHRMAAVLQAANIAVSVGGSMRNVAISVNPPTGGWMDEDRLPAIYLFVRSEQIQPATMVSDKRSFLIDVVLQARGASAAAVDQVDDMQLAVERAVAANHSLSGLCHGLRPVAAEIFLNKGEVVFAARRLTFEAQMILTRADPGV